MIYSVINRIKIKDFAFCLFGYVCFILVWRTWISKERGMLLLLVNIDRNSILMQLLFIRIIVHYGNDYMIANNTGTQCAINIFPPK